jgi:heme A synthase
MHAAQHHRAFAVTVIWTLGLLTLGSVVHATESSLACPDWPTCFGTMMPEMEGGVFWEHLHRLVAGGLVLMFGLATFLAWKQAAHRRWLFRAGLAGLALLLVQSVFGGLTVIFQLPDAVSTTHLTLAFTFLSLAVVLAAATSPRRAERPRLDPGTRQTLRSWGSAAAVLVFLQSIMGAWVRHTDSGMACPDFPTCLGEWVPPMANHFVAAHFAHRVLAVLATLAVVALAVQLLRPTVARHVRRAAAAALALVVAQFTLGVVSVLTILAVVPVSLHTLGAAALLSTLVLLATWGFVENEGRSDDSPPGLRERASETERGVAPAGPAGA